MKLKYVSKQKRRYQKLGKEFPNQDNTVEVEDNLGKLLLAQKVGKDRLWEEVKTRKVIKKEEE